MTTLPYSQLSTQQQAQAAWLFADACFGTDPEMYLYETENGQVTGRALITMPHTEKSRNVINVRMVIIKEEEISRSIHNSSTMHRDALAAEVAHRLYQKLNQETTPCVSK